MKSIYAVVWLLAYISIASVSSVMITPALPQIGAQFHLGVGAVEWVVSAFLIGYVGGQLIYGPLANAYGRLKALRLGLRINVFGLLVCWGAASYDHYLLLVTGRFITGLGTAAGLACTFMLINEWLPEAQRKSAMAYSILSFALGTGLAVLLGSLITAYWHWQGCFLFLMAYGLLLLWGCAVFEETLTQPKPLQWRSVLEDYQQALSSTRLLVFSLVLGTCTMIGYCFSAAGPQIAQDYLQLSVTEYGYWNVLNIIGVLIGGLSARELLLRFSIYQLVAAGFFGCALGLVSLIWMRQSGSHSREWFFITSFTLYWFSSYLFVGGSYMASNAITDRANASASMSFINMSFATLAVIIMGYISADPFLAFIVILAVVLLLVSGLLLLSSTRAST
ncbi:MAG: MFS transporter [Legionellaceae bacterium]|nr:MFS transporter [Legionellaceae bacterium]